MPDISPADVRELLRLADKPVVQWSGEEMRWMDRVRPTLAIPLARLCLAAGKGMKKRIEERGDCPRCWQEIRTPEDHETDCWAAALVKLAEEK